MWSPIFSDILFEPDDPRPNTEMRAILSDAETVEALQKQGFEPLPGPPDAATKRIQSETEKWRALVAKTGIKAE